MNTFLTVRSRRYGDVFCKEMIVMHFWKESQQSEVKLLTQGKSSGQRTFSLSGFSGKRHDVFFSSFKKKKKKKRETDEGKDCL